MPIQHKVDSTDEKGNTALYYASKKGNVAVIDALLRAGAGKVVVSSYCTFFVHSFGRKRSLYVQLVQ